jgi:hypothetical protein
MIALGSLPLFDVSLIQGSGVECAQGMVPIGLMRG